MIRLPLARRLYRLARHLLRRDVVPCKLCDRPITHGCRVGRLGWICPGCADRIDRMPWCSP